jgi:hypothetical protein
MNLFVYLQHHQCSSPIHNMNQLLHLSKQRVQAKRASYEHMRLVSCAQSRAKTQHSSLNKQRISKTTQQKFIYANTLDVSKTCTSKTLIPGGHQHFSYKTEKNV